MKNEKIPEKYLEKQVMLPKGWIKPDGSRYSLVELQENKNELFFEFYDFMYEKLLAECINAERQNKILALLRNCSPNWTEMIKQTTIPFNDPVKMSEEFERKTRKEKGEDV